MSLDPKISELPSAPSISSATVVPGVEGGVTYKITMAQITTSVSSGLTLGTASTYDIGLGGVSVPLLSNSNTWSDLQIINNGVKLKSSPSAGDPEAWLFSSSDGSATLRTNLTGSTQDFVFGEDGTFSAPAGFTFPGGLAIAQGGTGATSASDARNNLGIGTAGTATLGTSGATVPLLNTSNIWGATQTFSNPPVFSDTTNTRVALGLGTAATKNTGTSGTTVPMLDGANTWSAAQTFTLAPVFTDASGSRTALGAPAATTTISGGGLVTGGGDLSANRTLTVTAASSSTVRTGTSTTTAMTVGDTYSALAEVTLTDAATIAVDMSTFINARVTLGGNRTLGNPSNTKVGQSGYIAIVQDSGGSKTLSFASNWKRRGGAPTLTTTANAIDILIYVVVTSSYILYDVITNPS